MSNMQQLKDALTLTESMLTAIEQNKWSDISTLVAQRTELLNDVFPLEEALQTSQSREVLEKIIRLNSLVEQKCREARHSIQVELSQFNKNKKVAAAYQAS